MTLSPADKLYAKLAAQQAEEARATTKKRLELERSQARDRALKRRLREARRMVVGTLAEEAGLLADDQLVLTPDETVALVQGFHLLAGLIQRGELDGLVAQDAATEPEALSALTHTNGRTP